MKTTDVPPTVSEAIVVFADLRGYHRHICSKLTPEGIFEFLAAYYSGAQHAMDHSDGRIVKFMGDTILLLFPASNPDASIAVLRNLKAATDSFLSQRGYDSCLCIKAHVGPVAAGNLGDGNLNRFDICGLAVNHTALLPSGEWVLSDELRQRLKL